MNNDKISKAIKNVEGSSRETFVGFYESKDDFAIAWALEGMKIPFDDLKNHDIKNISKKLFDKFVFDKDTGAVFAPF